MALRVVWSQTADEQLAELIAYIADDNVDASQSLLHRIRSAAEHLSDHPYMFRPGRKPGTREMVVHPNYIVVYRVLTDAIDVVSVLHARREYP